MFYYSIFCKFRTFSKVETARQAYQCYYNLGLLFVYIIPNFTNNFLSCKMISRHLNGKSQGRI